MAEDCRCCNGRPSEGTRILSVEGVKHKYRWLQLVPNEKDEAKVKQRAGKSYSQEVVALGFEPRPLITRIDCPCAQVLQRPPTLKQGKVMKSKGSCRFTGKAFLKRAPVNRNLNEVRRK